MDKNKVGEFHFVTEPYLLDFRGRVTIPMIGNYLIHVASSHAAERGFGFNDMSERHTAWVLSRLAIEMIEYPAMSEPITLYTWVDEAVVSSWWTLAVRHSVMPALFGRLSMWKHAGRPYWTSPG